MTSVVTRWWRGFTASREFWTSLPNTALPLIMGAVFFLFSTLAFTADIAALGRLSLRSVVIAAILSGGTAAAWVLPLARGLRFLPVAVGLHLISITNSFTTPPPRSLAQPPVASIQSRLRFDSIALTTVVMLGYGLFIGFISGQGRRYMRVRTEIALATEIHQLLVPTIDRRIGPFEFFGVSHASGEVGGDLVDLVDNEGGWIAYLADVSGHGVGSGALMGMFKSAFRSRLTVDDSLGSVLADVNRVLLELRKPGMFVTGAFLAQIADGTTQFTLAGHPPILHYDAASGAVSELVARHTVIAMFEDQRYTPAAVTIEPGDVLALVSDGLIEVFDRHDREFGLTGLSHVLSENANRPLKEISAALFEKVRHHGPQLDDQSLLLVRRT